MDNTTMPPIIQVPTMGTYRVLAYALHIADAMREMVVRWPGEEPEDPDGTEIGAAVKLAETLFWLSPEYSTHPGEAARVVGRVEGL